MSRTIVVKPYSHSAQKNTPVSIDDYTELKENVDNILIGFNTYDKNNAADITKTAHVKSIGSQQHGDATSETDGFMPPNLAYKSLPDPTGESLEELEEKVNELVQISANDAYPERSIVVWTGNNNGRLPAGWYRCDGSTITLEDGSLFKTPDLRFCEPVSVTPGRAFTSRHTIGKRTVVDVSSDTNGDAITKWYIIKAPSIRSSTDIKVKFGVIQPEGIRIATNFTTNSKDVLTNTDLIPDGNQEFTDIIAGSKAIVTIIPKDGYLINRLLYVTDKSEMDVPVDKNITVDDKAVIQVQSLYKLSSWEQPILSKNGNLKDIDTLGMVVTSSGYNQDEPNTWKMFDNNPDTYRWWLSPSTAISGSVTIASTDQLKISKIEFTTSQIEEQVVPQSLNDLTLLGSSDGIHWELLASADPGLIDPGDTYTLQVNTENRYQLFRMLFTACKETDYLALSKINIVADTVELKTYQLIRP